MTIVLFAIERLLRVWTRNENKECTERFCRVLLVALLVIVPVFASPVLRLFNMKDFCWANFSINEHPSFLLYYFS